MDVSARIGSGSQSQLGLVLDRIKTRIDGSIECSEVGINSVDLNGVPGRTQLKLFLEVILPPVLNLLRRSRLWLYLLFLALLLRRAGH